MFNEFANKLNLTLIKQPKAYKAYVYHLFQNYSLEYISI